MLVEMRQEALMQDPPDVGGQGGARGRADYFKNFSDICSEKLTENLAR